MFLALIAVVGLCSTLVSPAYLRTAGRGWFSAERSRHWYYAALFVFWAALLAVPIAGNLAVAWLLVEATTAASALLIAFTGRRDALEAGWKYLVLTTLGLAVALLGHRRARRSRSRQPATAGLRRARLARARAQRRGAAPRGDARRVRAAARRAGDEDRLGAGPQLAARRAQRGAAPISALLSAALLPTVAARRLARRRRRSTPPSAARPPAALFIAFGLASLVVAVPFLWRPLPWKRLLAYSSLEHMGVIALGIGFGTPLAIAGVVIHVAGHGLAKALGFYAALPLLRVDPDAARRAPAGVARTQPADRDRDGRQPRRARRPAALAAVRLRAADPARRRRRPARSRSSPSPRSRSRSGSSVCCTRSSRASSATPRHGDAARSHRSERPIGRADGRARRAGCSRSPSPAVLLPGSEFVETLARGAL